VDPVSDLADRERDLNSLSLLTVIVVLVTVTMTFGALISVFLIRSNTPLFWEHIKLPITLWFTTAILITSSFTFESARRHLAQSDQIGFFQRVKWTTIAALLFLFGQTVAWVQILRSGVRLQKDPHSWFIFLFSGLHGIHILAGLAGLGYLLYRTREPVTGPKYQMYTRAVATGVAVFWHYLDALWVVLFILLWTWRR
jgi:cytochrome c oxidase subunit III